MVLHFTPSHAGAARAGLRAAAFLALASLVLTPAPAASGMPYVDGEVMIGLTVQASAQVATSRAPDVPGFLAPFGVAEIRRSLSLPVGPSRVKPALARYGLDRLYTLRVPPGTDVEALARGLEALPEIEYAHPNYLGRGGVVPVAAADTSFANQWNLENTGQTFGTPDADIDATEAWRTAVGRRETVVAVLDSGIDSDHGDIRGRILAGGADVYNGDPDPEEDHGHGTAVSGVILANANNAFAVAGVDWNARLLPIKLLNSSNSGTVNALVQGLVLAGLRGADVANMSLILYPDTPSIAGAVAFADEAGVILIGCNGNDGINDPNFPASYPEVLSVGWTNDDDLRSPGSNFTATLDVVAPGVSVPTLAWNTTFDTIAFWGGCSFATPHVTGVTSVLLGVDPTLTAPQVFDILRATAEDEVGNPTEDVPGRDDYYGWGRINMAAALDSLGLVSRSELHVDAIRMQRTVPNRMQVQVAVSDDLTGAEDAVEVTGTLTLPDAGSLPLAGTTAGNGVATLLYTAPAPALDPGAYTFAVDSLAKPGFSYSPSRNAESSRTHDPDLAGVHVGFIEMFDDGDVPGVYEGGEQIVIDVQVLDDDGLPEGGVQVRGTLTVPGVAPQVLLEPTSRAAGGVARLTYTPPGNATGVSTFQLVLLAKAGFVHETARDAETSETLELLATNGDEDADGTQNQFDNCLTVSNVAQSDADGDGLGDLCDLCPNRSDPAQDDTDGDAVGDRCDCAPYDPSAIGVGEALNLRFDATGTLLAWDGVVGADYYDVSRGSLAALGAQSLGDCLQDNLTATSLEELDEPLPGEGFFYLVRADDAVCGPGTLGEGAGAPRENLQAGACGS